MSAPLPHTAHPPPAGRAATCQVLWLHGGCFTKGDNTWSRAMARALARAGMTVYTVSFPQGPAHPWPEAMPPLLAFAQHVARKQPALPLYVGGESSGAFFAYALAVQLALPRCTVLCPVMDPWARQQRLKPSHAKARMQLAYFGGAAAMERASRALQTPPYAGTLTVCRGADDADADQACWPHAPHQHVHTVPGTHRLCAAPSRQVLQLVTASFQ